MKKRYIFILLSLLLAGCASTGSGRRHADGKANYAQAYRDYVSLGAQYLQKGRYDLAEPKLKRAIEIDSRPPEAWNVLAVLYEQTRNISEGYQVYEKLTGSHPDYALGFSNFATFLCKFDRNDELQKLLAQMRLKGNDFRALSYISEGNCMQKRNQLSAAEKAYKQALIYDAHAAGALLPLADISLQQGDPVAALRYLKVIHTYVGYSPESVSIGIKAARSSGDSRTEEELMRVMRANYADSAQAKALGI